MSLLPFIQKRLTVVEKEIKRDLYLWVCGKKHPNLEFSGSLESFYWEGYLENNISKIIQTAFDANRDLSFEHGIDPIISISDAEKASQQIIIRILNVMASYDKKMRCNSIHCKVAKRDIEVEKNRYFKVVEERANNEENLFKMPKKNTVNIPLVSEYGIYWYIKNSHFSVHIKLVSLAFTFLAIGFGLGKNETMRSLHNAFTKTESTTETASTKNSETIPTNIVQNIANTINEITKNESSKNESSE